MRLKGKKLYLTVLLFAAPGIVSDYSGNRDELLFMAYVDRKGICRYTEL